MSDATGTVPWRIIGDDPRTVSLREDLQSIALTADHVLLLGETGTGKEVAARVIHEWSYRRAKPFVPVNCAQLRADTAGSELFGHRRGSFTGAIGDHGGLLKAAHGGTLFLDEVADLPLAVQVQLLRTIDDGSVRPVGDTKDGHVDVRIIAATNQDLDARVDAGAFRKDLRYRFPFVVPLTPLRERPGDVAPLAAHFLETLSGRPGMNAAAKRFTTAAIERMRRASWPENVRGLLGAVKRALVRTRADALEELDVAHLGLADEDEARGRSPVALERFRASGEAALRDVAGQLIDALLLGEIPPGKLPSIAGRYPTLSLEFHLAAVFLARYEGSEARVMAQRLFSYESREAVARFCRTSRR